MTSSSRLNCEDSGVATLSPTGARPRFTVHRPGYFPASCHDLPVQPGLRRDMSARSCKTPLRRAGHAAVARPGDGWRNGSKGDVPAARTITGDPCVTGKAVETLALRSHDPKALIPPGLPPRGPAAGAGKEAGHGLAEVWPSLLLHSLRSGRQPREFGTRFRELTTLGNVPGRSGAAWPPAQLLLPGQIPHKPGVAAMLTQDQRLLRSRCDPVQGHKSNLLAIADTSEEVMRRPDPPPGGHLHAAIS